MLLLTFPCWVVPGVSPALGTSRQVRFCLWAPVVTTKQWLNTSFSMRWAFTTSSHAQTEMTTSTSGSMKWHLVPLVEIIFSCHYNLLSCVNDQRVSSFPQGFNITSTNTMTTSLPIKTHHMIMSPLCTTVHSPLIRMSPSPPSPLRSQSSTTSLASTWTSARWTLWGLTACTTAVSLLIELTFLACIYLFVFFSGFVDVVES